MNSKLDSAIGFLIGDMFGAPFEAKSKYEAMSGFGKRIGSYTDDTLMYLSVLKSFKKNISLRETLIEFYDPDRGYGNRMDDMLSKKRCEPSDSWGNGAATRTAALALFDSSTIDDVEKYCRVTHTHPESTKASIAVYISIKQALQKNKDLSKAWKVIGQKKKLESYSMGLAALESIPPAMIVFENGNSFDEILRDSISLGGDTDSIGAVAGALAGAYYGVPDSYQKYLKNETKIIELIKKYI